jgi:hypothetical protein
MNTIHDNGDNDRSLLESLDAIGRRYAKTEREEPPELLDMAIRNQAHRAVETKPRWMKFGWLHGLTTAAVFVLALTLIVKQQDTRPVEVNGFSREAQSRAPLETAAKKQAPALQSEDKRQAVKEQGFLRIDAPRAAPPPAPASAAADTVMADAAEEAAVSAGAVLEMKAQEKAGLDEDLRGNVQTPAREAVADALLTGNSAQAVPVSEVRQAAGAGTAAKAEAEAAATESDAEQQLQTIIRMRQTGDANWRAELDAFMESHPGYPLPEELKD